MSNTQPAPVASERTPLKARKVSFAWEKTPLHWVPGDPFTTHTINVLHLLLPAGERWFIHVYRQVLPYIHDEQLRQDVIGFIGQEAVHSQAHDDVLPRLKELGLDPTPYTAQVDWFFEKLLGDRTLPPGRARTWWLMERVALIAAIVVHERLREGEEVEIRDPRNRFPLAEAPAYLFVAGGIGITPILPMLRSVAASGADWRLLYGGRSRATMPFLDEIEKLGAEGGRVTVVAEDEAGHPDAAAALADTVEGTAVHCCGPEPLMDAVGAALPPGRTLHLERFTAAAAASTGSAPFEVELRRSGRTVRVPADRSVLAAVRDELPYVSYSCEQGFCGTCQQRVLEGEIDHRDELLTDSERDDSMLICVSRCRGERLVLDL